MSNRAYETPWGYYTILDSQRDHLIKRITVMPGMRTSMQFHTGRDEYMVCVRGYGTIQIGDNRFCEMKPGDTLQVNRGTNHRIKCLRKEPLVIVEIWLGPVLDEADITRLEDDYGR